MFQFFTSSRGSTHLSNGHGPRLQRKCACGGEHGGTGECAECRKKRENPLQRSAASPAPAPSVPPRVFQVLQSPGRPLERGTRALMESRFGHDFGRVRVHTDSRSAESARAVNALAYTVGQDVVFGAGQYAPATAEGRKLMAHELAHVVQQGSAPTGMQASSLVVGENDAYERAAEAAAGEVAAGRAVLPSTLNAPFGLQRQPAPGPAAKQEDCLKGWEKDPQSMSIVAARHFAATELDPGSADQLATTKCVNDHNCDVTLGSDLLIDVTWNKSLRRIGTGRSTDQGRRFCAFDYSCDATGNLVFNLIKCLGNPQKQVP